MRVPKSFHFCFFSSTTVGPPLWSAGFLPAIHQATFVSSNTRDKNFDPYKLIPNIHNDKFDIAQQRKELDLVKKLDALSEQQTYGASEADPQLAGGWAKARLIRRTPHVGAHRRVDADTAFCADVLARTYQAMGLLGRNRPSAFYDPGSFWSGDHLELTPGFSLGPEVAVER